MSESVVCTICGKEFPDMYDDNGEILKHMSTHSLKEILIVAFWNKMLDLKDE
jgi:hypothetical protein